MAQIGAGTLDFKLGSSDITGNLTDLTIYANGFAFDSVTVNDTGSINFGSILTLINPSVTLTVSNAPRRCYPPDNCRLDSIGWLGIAVKARYTRRQPIMLLIFIPHPRAEHNEKEKNGGDITPLCCSPPNE